MVTDQWKVDAPMLYQQTPVFDVPMSAERHAGLRQSTSSGANRRTQGHGAKLNHATVKYKTDGRVNQSFKKGDESSKGLLVNQNTTPRSMAKKSTQ